MDTKLRYNLYLEIGDEKCVSPRMMEQISAEQVDPDKFVCDISENRVLCTDNATCYFQPATKTFIADYSKSNLTKAPRLSSAIRNTTIQRMEIILSGNSIDEMPGEDMGYDNCAVLDMSNNRISSFDWLPETLEVSLLLY